VNRTKPEPTAASCCITAVQSMAPTWHGGARRHKKRLDNKAFKYITNSNLKSNSVMRLATATVETSTVAVASRIMLLLFKLLLFK
jgi:hypothetical protein